MFTIAVTAFLCFAPYVTEAAPERPAPPGGLTAASHFESKDLPQAEPEHPAWSGEAQPWSYGVAFAGKWVYASCSKSGYVLTFHRDPATAQLAYRGAIPLGRRDPDVKEPGWSTLTVRRITDGAALLYATCGTHHESILSWFSIDDATGQLTLLGRQDPALKPVVEWYSTTLWTPDQNRYYVAGGTCNKIEWFEFGPDGAPGSKGTVICRNASSTRYRGRGHAILSPDGRQLYLLLEKSADPKGKLTAQVDTYSVDPKTGVPTYSASLDLPDLGSEEEVNGFGGFSPDARHLYIFNAGATGSYILERDPNSGSLSVVASVKAEEKFRGLGGPAWDRAGRFAFDANGKRGYYLGVATHTHALGSFDCDPQTGALSNVATADGAGMSHLCLDAANGNLFICGPTITSWKTPGSP